MSDNLNDDKWFDFVLICKPQSGVPFFFTYLKRL